jgi:hypothetical protein
VKLVAIMVMSACATPVTPAITARPVTPAPTGPPALFAEIFHAGATWTFSGETVNVEGPDRSTDTGEVTCEITTASAIARGWLAELTCSGMTYANLVDGTYVATIDGLWQVDGASFTDISALVPGEMLVAAVPTPIKRETRQHDVIDAGDVWSAQANGASWCISHDSWGGDEGGWALCIEAGKGIVGGSGYFAGGFTHDTYFGAVPRH